MSIIIGVGGRGGRNNWGRVPRIRWHPVRGAGGYERSGSGGGGMLRLGRGNMVDSVGDLGGSGERRDRRPRIVILRSGMVGLRRLLRSGSLRVGGALELRRGRREPLGEQAEGVSEGGAAVGGRARGVGAPRQWHRRGGCRRRPSGRGRSPLQANQGGERLQ